MKGVGEISAPRWRQETWWPADRPQCKIAPVEVCEECGLRYDSTAPEGVGSGICDGVAEFVGLLAAIDDPARRRRHGLWSPLEYACHLRDMLLVQRERVLLARRVERPVAVPMGRDERVEHDGYAEQDPADVARQLNNAAALFANVLKRLPESDWKRTVLYSYPEPADRTLAWVAAHTLHEVRHHLLDIERQR
jgi:hypothetical protein